MPATTSRSRPTSRWSEFSEFPPHFGVDFPARDNQEGEPVKAIKAGRVIEAGAGTVKISTRARTDPQDEQPKDDVQSWYLNLRNITVHQGDTVTKGQQIAEIGPNNEGTAGTGGSGATGPHAHWRSASTTAVRTSAASGTRWSSSSRSTPAAAVCASSATGTLEGSDNQQKVFNFFVSKGYTKEQAAGIVGNMMAESGVNPRHSSRAPPPPRRPRPGCRTAPGASCSGCRRPR